MRFAREIKLLELEKEFKLKGIAEDLSPSYNVSPTQRIPAIYNDGNAAKIGSFKWGLVPSWAKDVSIGNKMLNARGETIHEKPSFRDAFKKRRCIIPANGYYEWFGKAPAKVPVYIQLKSEKPFGMAGLWEARTDPDGGELRTCTIITIESNELLRPHHHRMPVILEPENYEFWLDPLNNDVIRLRELIKPYSSDLMKFFEVSKQVNSPKNNSPDNIKPV